MSVPDDLTVLRESRDAANALFAERVAAHRRTSWTRTPERFDIAGDTATERGLSLRRWQSNEVRSDYVVTWRRTIAPNGTAVWTVEREEYATMPR